MSRLTPNCSSNGMMREYVEKTYLPAAQTYHRRLANKAQLTKELSIWHRRIQDSWHELRFGKVHITPSDEGLSVEVEAYFGGMVPRWIQVELFANSPKCGEPICINMAQKMAMPGMVNAFLYQATIPKSPTPNHYTARHKPFHSVTNSPGEAQRILWQR